MSRLTKPIGEIPLGIDPRLERPLQAMKHNIELRLLGPASDENRCPTRSEVQAMIDAAIAAHISALHP